MRSGGFRPGNSVWPRPWAHVRDGPEIVAGEGCRTQLGSRSNNLRVIALFRNDHGFVITNAFWVCRSLMQKILGGDIQRISQKVPEMMFKARSTPPCFLVLVCPALVALDIGLTLSDDAPAARIITVQTTQEATSALVSVTSLTAAFLSVSPATSENSTLLGAIRARGGRIILIDHAAEAAELSPEWSVLERPFTSADILACVPKLASTEACGLRRLIVGKPANEPGYMSVPRANSARPLTCF